MQFLSVENLRLYLNTLHSSPSVRSGEKCTAVGKSEKMFPRQLSKQPTKEMASFVQRRFCKIDGGPDANINIWETAVRQRGGARADISAALKVQKSKAANHI